MVRRTRDGGSGIPFAPVNLRSNVAPPRHDRIGHGCREVDRDLGDASSCVEAAEGVCAHRRDRSVE